MSVENAATLPKKDTRYGIVPSRTKASQFACDFCSCVNSPRRNPSEWIEPLCDPSYRPRDEPRVKLDLRYSAHPEFGELPSLQIPDKICRISTTCALNSSSGFVARTQDISNPFNRHVLSGCVVCEIYRVFAKKPESEEAVVGDSSLGVGRGQRSHRNGMIDPDFTAVGACLYNTPAIGYVLFVHLPIDLPSPNDAESTQSMAAETLVGAKRCHPEISRPIIAIPSPDDGSYGGDSDGSKNRRARPDTPPNTLGLETQGLATSKEQRATVSPAFRPADIPHQYGNEAETMQKNAKPHLDHANPYLQPICAKTQLLPQGQILQ